MGLLFTFLGGLVIGAWTSYEVMHHWFGCRKHPIQDGAEASAGDSPTMESFDALRDADLMTLLTNLSFLIENHQHARISAEDTLRVINQEARTRLTCLEARHPESLLEEARTVPFGPFSAA